MFGGDRPFTPPAVLADACERNCSFVSGHAATAFSLIAVAWVARNRWWLLGGAALGALVGLGRMAQGGHFLSDIVFAFWVTYLVALLAARLVLGQRSITGAPRPAGPDAR
jgi:lipid A 4'-phosphatase